MEHKRALFHHLLKLTIKYRSKNEFIKITSLTSPNLILIVIFLVVTFIKYYVITYCIKIVKIYC